MPSPFTLIDWAVLVGYLAFTTWLGVALAGKQQTIREFFLGGRTLPWWAVSGSIIATEISAVTLISVPAIVYGAGGDLRYLQLAIGAVLARVIIGIWFVPAFYEREIYSPYDYMANRLGAPVRRVTTGLFILGTVLAQSARLLLPAIILEEIAGIPMAWSIWIIGAVSIFWTLLGGITTVIWTDVIQFLVFLVAIIAALIFVTVHVNGGWETIQSTAAAAGKLRIWNLSIDPNVEFTLWAGLIGNTLLCLNAYGTDQMVAQRMFTCRTPRQASVAIISSSVGLIVMILALAVGLGLFAYYQQHPLTGDLAARVAKDKDRIFPIFIVHVMPVGLKGLIIASLFAAASLTSALAALAQTVVTGFYQPWRNRRTTAAASFVMNTAVGEPLRPGFADTAAETSRHDVFVSRVLIVVFGIALCALAQFVDLARARYGDILRLALSMATYTGGTLLAAFLLAFWRLNVDYRGILWAAPVSVLTVFAITWHEIWAQLTTMVLAVLVLVVWIAARFRNPGQQSRSVSVGQTLLLTCALALVVTLATYNHDSIHSWRHLAVAFPWNVPIGFVVAFTLGYFLARPNPSGDSPRDVLSTAA